jgi:hypothetical protein
LYARHKHKVEEGSYGRTSIAQRIHVLITPEAVSALLNVCQAFHLSIDTDGAHARIEHRERKIANRAWHVSDGLAYLHR